MDEMTREELIRYAASLLRSDKRKKPLRIQKHTFRILDDEGNAANFTIKKKNKSAMYTVEDVRVILDALIKATEEAIKQGESVTIQGFGTLGLKYRKPRSLKHVATGERTIVEGHYVPKFVFGKSLKTCASIYEDNKEKIDARKELPWYAIMD